MLERHAAHDSRYVAAICAAPAVVLAAHGVAEHNSTLCSIPTSTLRPLPSPCPHPGLLKGPATCYPADTFRKCLVEAKDDKVRECSLHPPHTHCQHSRIHRLSFQATLLQVREWARPWHLLSNAVNVCLGKRLRRKLPHKCYMNAECNT